MQNQKIVSATVVGFGVALWFVLNAGIVKVFDHYDLTFGIYDAIKHAIPLLVSAVSVFVLLKNITVTNFLTEVVVELRKVTWPSSKDTWSATFVVIVFVIIISFILGAMDLGWAYLVQKLIIR